MAYMFPDEGIEFQFDIFPLNNIADPTTLYVGLFTGLTATTVPSRNAILSTQTGVTEVSNVFGYGRQPVLSTEWGAPVVMGAGLQISRTSPVQFDNTGVNPGDDWDEANGYFLSESGTHGAGTALYYANFSDGQSFTLLSGESTFVLPQWRRVTC